MAEHGGDDGVIALAGHIHLPCEEPTEAAQEVAAPRHHHGKQGGDHRTLYDGRLVFDGVELLGHLGQAPGAQGGEDHHGGQVKGVWPEEGGKDPRGIRYAGIHHPGQGVHGHRKPAELLEGGYDDDHDASQHDDALDEVVDHRGHVAAGHHIDGGEQGHDEDTQGVVNGKGHGEKPGQAVVQGCRIGDQEYEHDQRRADTQAPVIVTLFEEVGHGLALQVLGHDPGAAAQNGPGQVGADDGVAQADPGGGDAVLPPELAGIAYQDDRGKIGGAVGEGGKPSAHRTSAQHKSIHAARMAAAVQADQDHQPKEYHQHNQLNRHIHDANPPFCENIYGAYAGRPPS